MVSRRGLCILSMLMVAVSAAASVSATALATSCNVSPAFAGIVTWSLRATPASTSGTNSDPVDLHWNTTQQRQECGAQCVAHAINTVGIDSKRCVIGLADRCADNKRRLIERHGAANAKHHGATVVVEQDRCQTTCGNPCHKRFCVD